MRRVGAAVRFVVVRRALGLFAGNQILDRTSRQPDDSRHLGNNFHWKSEVMNREPAHDDIEFAVLERQPRLDVTLLELTLVIPAPRASSQQS